jgi:hypothetical protein
MTHMPFWPYHTLPPFWDPELPRLHPGTPFGYPPNPCLSAAMLLIEAVNAKQVAATLAEGELRSQLEKTADETIEAVIDDWCGTLPPRPLPGPPLGAEIASVLAAFANTVAAEDVRRELLSIAGQALARSAGAPGDESSGVD